MENYPQQFFDRMSEKLEELYPKGDIARSKALVFNAYANIIFNEILASQKQHYKERVDEYIRERMKQIANSPFLERRNGFEELTTLNKDLALDIFGEGEL